MEGIPTLPNGLTVLNPDDRDRVAKTLERIFRENVRIDVTYRVDHPKQEHGLCTARESSRRGWQGHAMIGNTLDITEQENAAQELQTANFICGGERLAHMGSWSLKSDEYSITGRRRRFALFGFDPSEAFLPLPNGLTVLHPDDRDRVAKTLDENISRDVRIDVTYRVDHPKQGKRIMHSTGEPVVEDDKVTRLIGTRWILPSRKCNPGTDEGVRGNQSTEGRALQRKHCPAHEIEAPRCLRRC